MRAALNLPADDVALDPIILTSDTIRVRRGHELRLIIPSPKAPSPPAQRNEKLVGLAADANRCRTPLEKLAVLGCLAPDIVTAIVGGRQPLMLDHRPLMAIDLPLGRDDQRAPFGIR